METIKKHPLKDGIFITGLIFIVISFIVFLFPEWKDHQGRSDFFSGLFFLNFILAAGYLITLFVKGIVGFRSPKYKTNVPYMPLFLVLFSISAYTLNQDIPIFDESTNWLTVYLIIIHASLILYCFKDFLPHRIKVIMYFLLGVASIMFLYYAIYLIPYYPIGITVCWFFGISLHVFVPLIQVIYIVVVIFKYVLEKKAYIYSFIAGFILPIIFTSFFCLQWNRYSNMINHEYSKAVMNEDNTLPAWVKVSQKLPNNWIIQRMLKAGALYSTPRKNFRFFDWDMPRRNFESPEHDPLVMIAAFTGDEYEMDLDDKYQIIESLYDSRHESEERLWSGDKLETDNVTTNVKIIPQFRMAYTEKIISIGNRGNKDGWRGRQEEAIYSFTLPEGSVVTSLSLWINGKEEKGHLTTKSKADTAYKTIVGVESRDPSVIHWKEGNNVSVRVFPCTPEENRRFKIGITSPLKIYSDKLIYENIYFKGPAFKSSAETIQLAFEEKVNDIDFPFSFDEEEDLKYITTGSYKPSWEVSFKAPALSNKSFAFDGKSYHMENYEKAFEKFSAEKVYLDINQSWSESEFEKVFDLFKNKELYAFNNKLVKLTEENKDKTFEKLSELKFSVFPIYEIKDQEKALIITKNDHPGPFLKDIKNSPFATSTGTYLNDSQKIRLFNLGNELSPYLKTLKEFRTFIYDNGDTDYLKSLVNDSKFVKGQEDATTVVIENAGIKIKESSDSINQNAPDHLLRLYAYNNILKSIGKDYFTHDFVRDDLINQAQKAYVVSPVSSLIVLETQQDYDRFGIKDTNNSLKNASMSSSGSVPEPHEWLLIILSMLTVIYLKFKNRLKLI